MILYPFQNTSIQMQRQTLIYWPIFYGLIARPVITSPVLPNPLGDCTLAFPRLQERTSLSALSRYTHMPSDCSAFKNKFNFSFSSSSFYLVFFPPRGKKSLYPSYTRTLGKCKGLKVDSRPLRCNNMISCWWTDSGQGR